MGNSRSLRRRMKPSKVWMAGEVFNHRKDMMMKAVEERAGKDAEFAKDLLKAVSKGLPDNIKKVAEETIAKSIAEPEKLPEGRYFGFGEKMTLSNGSVISFP